jgi:hypothetical protein
MFSSKVAGSLIVLMTGAAIFLYLHLGGAATETARAGLTDRLRVAHRMVEQSRRLNDFALAARAAEVARDNAVADVLEAPREKFLGPDDKPVGDDDYLYERHKLMNDVVARWQTQFAGLSDGSATARAAVADARVERPDYFAIVDKGAIGVAKFDDKGWFGPTDADLGKTYPALVASLAEGRSVLDLWTMKDTPMVVAVEPVRRGEAVVGAVIIGYWLTAAEAKRDQGGAGFEVAYYVGDRIRQSSTVPQSGEAALTEALKRDALPTKTGAREPVVFKLGERSQLGFVGRIVGRPSAGQAGFIVFGDLDNAVDAAVEPTLIVPILLLVVLVGCIGLVLLFFRQYMRPFDEIDQGILEIINGNADRWFEAPKGHPAGAMSQNLNIMICQLMGRPLPDEEEGVTARPMQTGGDTWAEDRLFIEALDASEFHMKTVDSSLAEPQAVGVPASADSQSGLAPDILRLIRETEDSYRKRLFKEYTEALRGRGEPVPTMEQFAATLQSNADALRAKVGCTRVRFLVVTRDGRVSLKPVPIN